MKLALTLWMAFAPPEAASAPEAAPEAEVAPEAAPAPAPEATPDDADQDDIVVSARLTEDVVHIGDLMVYEVTVAFPAGTSVNLPMGLDFAPLELVDTVSHEPEPTGDGQRRRFEIQLQYFDVGEAKIPAFPLTVVNPGGEVATRNVPAHEFVVQQLSANESDPQRRGEDDPVSPAYPNTFAEILIWSFVGGGLVVGLGALVLWLLLRNRTKVVPAKPRVPAHLLALASLDELGKRSPSMVKEGRHADVYLQLTEIAKAYVQGRFGFDALDRTTDELRFALRGAGDAIAPLDVAEFIAFLDQCDLVKFARFAPPPDEVRESLDEVRNMVEASRPDRAPERGQQGDVPVPAEPRQEGAA